MRNFLKIWRVYTLTSLYPQERLGSLYKKYIKSTKMEIITEFMIHFPFMFCFHLLYSPIEVRRIFKIYLKILKCGLLFWLHCTYFCVYIKIPKGIILYSHPLDTWYRSVIDMPNTKLIAEWEVKKREEIQVFFFVKLTNI